MANITAWLFSRYCLIPMDPDNLTDHKDVPLITPGTFTMVPDCKVKIQKNQFVEVKLKFG